MLDLECLAARMKYQKEKVMKTKIQNLIDRYNAGRLSQSGFYRRICALHLMQAGNRIRL